MSATPPCTSSTLRAVSRLATPAIAQSLLHTLVFLIDRAMLGRYSADALASMQISNPVVWSIYSVLAAFGVGTVALVGRAVGARDRPLATAAARASVLFAAAAGFVASLLGWLVLPLILALFPEAGAGVQTAARGYLSVLLPGMPFVLLSIIGGAILQASGDTRTPFLVAALGNVINVAVNAVLIFGAFGAPRLGATGAAIGSVAAMAVSAVLLLVVLSRSRGEVSLRGAGGERAAMARMWRVSVASFGERIVQQSGFMGFVAMIGLLGSTAMAANQALISIESICFLSADGFGIAGAAIVAQRLGAGRADDAALGVRVATWLAVLLLSACGLVFLIVPELLLGAFTPDAHIVALGVPCLWVAAAAQPFMAVAVVLGESLRGAGATRVAFATTLVGGLAVRLLATWFFAFELSLGLVGVWLGSTADWVVRCAMLVPIFARGRWRSAQV